jgi:hypothetical protein
MCISMGKCGLRCLLWREVARTALGSSSAAFGYPYTAEMPGLEEGDQDGEGEELGCAGVLIQGR